MEHAFNLALPVRMERTSAPIVMNKEALGQYMTSRRIADFMSSLFTQKRLAVASLLDAGAGSGTLSCSFIERWISGAFAFERLNVDAYEIDPGMCAKLTQAVRSYSEVSCLSTNLVFSDFIEHAVDLMKSGAAEPFTHCILNPPYKKIGSASKHRQLLRQVGIEAVNLYSAFVALCLLMLDSGGELVAIIPRSFCNGLYYLPFRQLLLNQSVIRHIHLFSARDKAFESDGVLQENVIIHLERGGAQGDVTISTSTDDQFYDYSEFELPFKQIVKTGDSQVYIHIPTDTSVSPLSESTEVRFKLSDLHLEVCTGSVVDFRAREFLLSQPGEEYAPLLYPFHFTKTAFLWPRTHARKPNALRITPETNKFLMPIGYYVVLKRFTSKEEKRRIVAHLIRPDYFQTNYVAFENHLNVIHSNRRGIDEELARGLTVFLNSSFIDDYFRRFSGHTQVNATDLRLLNFPSQDSLRALGQIDMEAPFTTPSQIDMQVLRIL